MKDDEKTFRTVAIKADDAFVVLDSRDEDLHSALEIGKIIRIKDYSTVVMNSECASVHLNFANLISKNYVMEKQVPQLQIAIFFTKREN